MCSVLFEAEQSICPAGNNEDQWATQGRSLPRSLLWSQPSPFLLFTPWLSLDSFESLDTVTKGPLQEVCTFYRERGHSEKQVINFYILLCLYLSSLASSPQEPPQNCGEEQKLKITLRSIQMVEGWNSTLLFQRIIEVCKGWSAH